MSAGAEKRTSPRIPVMLTAHCRIGNRHVKDAVADLSKGGLYLKTKEPAKQGTPVRVALALGQSICTLVGEVRRVDRDQKGSLRGLGVAFTATEISIMDQQALQGFLEQAA
jgi:hypothetical protein